ncbi:MAG: TRAP transporter fused permease subunit [Candidatus Nezhaarchaeales archaeon]
MHKAISKVIPLLIFIFSLAYFSISVYFFSTGFMGTMYIVLILVPLAFIVYVLRSLRDGTLYPKLGFKVNALIAAVYIALCIYLIYYLTSEYINLIWLRAGAFNLADKIVAVVVFLLMMEYSRREHKVLFYLNLFLMFYCVYGWLFPGVFGHPGVSWERVITSSTVEIKLGTFGTYAQTGAGIIGAFMLILGVAIGVGVQESIVKVIVKGLGRRVSLAPQTAVLSSMALATSSGSGAAISTLTGQFTIPLMKSLGFPPAYAASVEGASALGGLIMPPVMAIAAFLMADFLGVSYFEVMARGFAPAFVYYFTIAFSVYLMTLRYVRMVKAERVEDVLSKLGVTRLIDKLNFILFFTCLAALIYLMGGLWWPEMRAALTATTAFLIIALTFRVILHEASGLKGRVFDLLKCLRRTIEGFTLTLVDLMLLLAVLGIMINLFTVSGWLLKLGMMMMSLGEAGPLALITITFIIGMFLGLGLPPSATYILTAIIIAPAMIALGFNPWITHFYAFFIAMMSEYTPPTSLSAAVTSRIAGASFMETMLRTLQVSIPIFFLTFTLFNWGDLVIEPGVKQLAAVLMVTVGCLGVSLAIYGKLSRRRALDIALRGAAMALGLMVLFHPERTLCIVMALVLIPLLILGVRRSRKLY